MLSQKFTRFFLCFAILAGVGISGANSAQAALLFNTGTGPDGSGRSAGNGAGQGIIANTATNVTNMAMELAMPNGGHLKYMIWDGANSNLLFSQVISVAASYTPTFVMSDPFSFNLTAGNTYYFGAIADNSMGIYYMMGSVSAQNGLQPLISQNSNYNNFDNPTVSNPGRAVMALQLFGTSPNGQAVPEPGTLALFGLSLVGLGIARRKKAA